MGEEALCSNSLPTHHFPTLMTQLKNEDEIIDERTKKESESEVKLEINEKQQL